MRRFPGVWKLPLLRLPSRDGSPSLALLSLFLSFIFCPTSFWRQWAAFLGAWCPQLRSEVVLWSLLSVQLFFRWICRGESGLLVLVLRHLGSSSSFVVFIVSLAPTAEGHMLSFGSWVGLMTHDGLNLHFQSCESLCDSSYPHWQLTYTIRLESCWLHLKASLPGGPPSLNITSFVFILFPPPAD